MIRPRHHIPPLVGGIAVIALAMTVLPLVALVARVNWNEFSGVVQSGEALGALGLSFASAAFATLCVVILGVPLAMVIARSTPGLSAFLRGIVMVPLLMPPLVGGVALLSLWGKSGLLGGTLHWFGITLPFSPAAVVMAQMYVSCPFLVIAVEQAIRGIDPRLELTARTLGATRTVVVRRILLPCILPAIGAGAALSFARCLAEFGATAMFAGNVAGRTRTMPLAIYTAFNGGTLDVDQAYALSVIFIAAAVLVLVAVRGWRAGGVVK